MCGRPGTATFLALAMASFAWPSVLVLRGSRVVVGMYIELLSSGAGIKTSLKDSHPNKLPNKGCKIA